MAYSLDLRERVIEAVDKGKHINEVAETFKICTRVIYNWLDLRKQTNSLKPKTGYQKGHSHKITDWDDFKIFASNHKHRTVKEMISIWEKEKNYTMSDSVMERALKKIGYTSKKKLLVIKKQTKKNDKNF